MSGAEVLLDIAGLSVAFGHNAPVVSNLGLQVRRGEIVALVGESGSGKSVTARTLLGLAGRNARVSADRFMLRGRDVSRLTERQWRALRGAEVGLILQDALNSLDPLRPIHREVGEALTAHRWGTRSTRRARVIEALNEAGLDEAEERRLARPGELSGGQRQRALIAQALALDPPLLIADEPTTALDPTVQARLLGQFEQLRAAGRGILLISHDLSLVGSLADTIVVLKDGFVVEAGTPDRILHQPQSDYTQRLVAAIPGLPRRPRPASAGPPAIEARNLGKVYPLRAGRGERVALGGISFDVRQGATLGVVGESGSGKTTLVWTVSGLLKPDAGDIRIFGEPWVPLSHAARRERRHSVQVVYQDPLSSFDPRHTVAGVLDDALKARRIRRAERPARIAQLLDQVSLSSRHAAFRPLDLSGGQRQRLAIARALAVEPSIVVFDEPVSALDPLVQAQILDLLDRLQRELGLTYIFVSHDLAVVRQMSDEVIVLSAGRIVEHGATERIFSSPAHPYTRLLVNALPAPARRQTLQPANLSKREIHD